MFDLMSTALKLKNSATSYVMTTDSSHMQFLLPLEFFF